MKANAGWTGITFNHRDPVYTQVVLHFKERLVAGCLKPGDVIPSRRELAALLKINPNTAQRAYKEMEEQKLIVTEGNLPSRITHNAEVLHAIRAKLLEDAVTAFIASVRNIDVPIDELLEWVRQTYLEVIRGENTDGGGHQHD